MRRKLNPKGNLLRAERKIKRFSDTKEWCGCLTPSEALALLNDGGQPAGSMYSKDRLENKISEGDCKSNWFYFYPSKKQLERWM